MAAMMGFGGFGTSKVSLVMPELYDFLLTTNRARRSRATPTSVVRRSTRSVLGAST